MELNQLLEKVVKAIVNPLLLVLMAVATIVFVWGLFEFVRGADKPEVRKQGQEHILWGLIGLAIMVSVFAIIGILLNTLGIKGDAVPAILQR